METSTRFSAPLRSATSPASSSQGGVETLYNHPNARIIAFTATARAVPRSPARDSDEDLGSLSWSSQLERTIAVGAWPPSSYTNRLPAERPAHANNPLQELSESTAPQAPSPSSTAAPPSSPSCPAASAGA
ncbi:hypothetical protein IMZ48_34905 [Candidatus Bathyarchaeota archaeon]|nr:hypothetical protein [Candidatus Bathyarchaeota archaeon]